MSFIGSMFSNDQGSGFQATPANIQRVVPDAQVSTAYDQTQSGIAQQQAFLNALSAQNGIGNQASVFAQQQQLANQLQGVANGTGPNPALAQLNNTTGANVANQAALMAGQRGSGANPGLMARLAAQYGGNLQQQAVGQGAALQAQQQLAGMNALQGQQANMAGVAGQQVGQQASALGNYNQFAQGQQNNLLNAVAQGNNAAVAMQSNINNANAGIAQGNQKFQTGLLGGAINGASSAMGMAGGAAAPAGGAPAAAAMAQGGEVPQSYHHKFFNGGEADLKEGGHVPGDGKVAGDSYANDTVPAMLSPHEIVIPRHITMGENAPQRAAEFVAQILAKKKVEPKGNFDEGGQVIPGEEVPNQDQNRMPAGVSGSWDTAPANPMPASIPETPVAPQQMPVPQMQGSDISGIQSGINKEKNALQMEAGALGQQGKQEAQVTGQAAQDLSAQNESAQKHFNDLDQTRQQLMSDVANGHVDPQRYLGSMSTGQKVSTAIGLILGGIGSGVTGGENPAMKFLNNQIENDIKSQETELGKKKTLLDANLHQFGNLHDAQQMTRVNMMDVASLKLKQAAAQAQDPIAKANALKASAELDIKAAELLGPMKFKQQLLSQASSSNQDPEKLVPYLVPKEHQKEAFTEIKQAQSASQNESKILDAFDRAAKENTVLRTGAGFLRTPPSIMELNALSLPIIHDSEGRVNEFEQKTLSDLHPKAGDTDEKIASKRNAFVDFIHQKKAAPVSKGFGIDLQKFQSTSADPYARLDAQKKGYADWAKKNINDKENGPMARATLEKLGIK